MMYPEDTRQNSDGLRGKKKKKKTLTKLMFVFLQIHLWSLCLCKSSWEEIHDGVLTESSPQTRRLSGCIAVKPLPPRHTQSKDRGHSAILFSWKRLPGAFGNNFWLFTDWFTDSWIIKPCLLTSSVKQDTTAVSFLQLADWHAPSCGGTV